MAELKLAQNNSSAIGSSWFYKLMLFASFLIVSIFPATGMVVADYYFNYGNLFDLSSPNFSFIVLNIVVDALVAWLVFELLFYLYRYVLSYNIYSFILPNNKFKNEGRLFFIYRNIIYAVFVNLCFFIPYLYMWLPLISIVVSFSMVLLFALHINKAYAEPIIGHFVFKSFVYPVFVFEIVSLIWQVVEVLS